jgi:hypothetical protein
MWWKDMKMRMCLIVGIIILLIVIIVPTGMSILCSLPPNISLITQQFMTLENTKDIG